jgi:hypothetical protein
MVIFIALQETYYKRCLSLRDGTGKESTYSRITVIMQMIWKRSTDKEVLWPHLYLWCVLHLLLCRTTRLPYVVYDACTPGTSTPIAKCRQNMASRAKNCIFVAVVKKKKFLSMPWRRIQGLEVKIHLFLTSAPDGGEWLTWRPGRFAPVLTVRSHCTQVNKTNGSINPSFPHRWVQISVFVIWCGVDW